MKTAKCKAFRHGLLIVCLMLSMRLCGAEEAWRPLLYEIKVDPPCYILGTIHLPDERLANFPPELQAAFDRCTRVYNEIPMAPNMQTVAAMAMLDLKLEPLNRRLTPKTYQRVADELKRYGVPTAGFDKMRTWAIAVSLPLLEFAQLMQTQKPLDVLVYERAVTTGKTTGGLEKVQDQLGIFETLSDHEQVRFLEATLDQIDTYRKQGHSPVDDLTRAYFGGDEAALVRVIEEQDDMGFDKDDPLAQRLLDALITKRDENFANRIEKLIGLYPGQSQFYAIGAAHLVGEESVVTRLRAKGLEIERVEPAVVSNTP